LRPSVDCGGLNMKEFRTAHARCTVVGVLAATLLAAGCAKHQTPPAAAPPVAPQHPETAQSNPAPSNPAAEAEAASLFDPKLNPDAAVGVPLDPHTLTPTQLQYGIAPKRDPHVTYASDVILMEEGDKAIKMAASDGMTWVFDASAPHVSEFEEGKIVFATGRAVGRIGQLQRNGATVTVRLAPVQITDVIKKGHFIVNGPLHPKNFIIYSAPDFPAAVDLNAAAQKPAANWDLGNAPRLWRTALQSLPAPPMGGGAGGPVAAPPAAIGQAPAINLDKDGLDIYPLSGSDTSVGVEFVYKKNGVYLKSDGRLRLGKASVSFDLLIDGGGIETFGMKVEGMASMELDFESSTAKDQFVNASFVADPNVDMTIPMPVGGVPLSLTVSTKFIFKTGFSAKTSTLTAHAKYSADGSLFIGKRGHDIGVMPKVTTDSEANLGRTADGVSVGINSMILTFNIQPMVGIGAFGFTTGLYVDIDFGGDVVRQSDVALPCREGFMRAGIDAGVGYKLPGPLVAFVNTLLKSFTRYQIDRTGSILQWPTDGSKITLLGEKTTVGMCGS
jgi:hypothetical protein